METLDPSEYQGHREPGRQVLGQMGRATALVGVCAALGVGLSLWPLWTLAALVPVLGLGLAFLCHPIAIFSVYYGLSLFTLGVRAPGFPLSLNQVFYLAFFGALLRWGLTRRLWLPRGWPLWATVALGTFLTGSAWCGGDEAAGRVAAKTAATLCVVSLAAAAVLTGQGRTRGLFWAIVAPTALSGFLALAEAAVGHDILGDARDYFGPLFRVNGFSPNAVVFAHTCMFALPFALWLARRGASRGERRLALGSAFFLLLLCVMTLNRQTLAMLGPIVLLAAWLFRGRLGRSLLLGAVLGAVVCGPVLVPAAARRMRTLSEFDSDPSFRIRRDNALNAWEIVKDRPWFGCGLGCYTEVWWETRSLETYYAQYEVDVRRQVPDMNYLRLAAETGLVGLGLNLLYYAAMMALVWRARRRALAAGRPAVADYASALLLGWAIFLLSSATQDTVLYLRTWLLFALSVPLWKEGLRSRR
jgi:O-antigen ligase